MLAMFIRLIHLEIRSLTRDIQGLLIPIAFLLVFALLFPLGISPKSDVLSSFAAGISWLGLLFSLMLNLDRLFRDDKEQGILEMWLSGGVYIILFIQARILAYWLMTGVPVALASLLLAFIFSLPTEGYIWLFASLLSGSLVLISIGTFIASLTLSSSRASMLIALLLVPMLVPVVIFGVESVSLAIAQAEAMPALMLLLGLALINMVIAPVLTMLSLRNLIE